MKKSILISCLILAISSLFAQYGGGNGTESDPFRIYTLQHLEEFSTNIFNETTYDGVHFILMNNIADSLRRPIGFGFNTGQNRFEQKNFSGIFNGNKNFITIAIDITDYDYFEFSLFYVLESNGVIKDLTVNGYFADILGLVHTNNGHILNCINNVSNLRYSYPIESDIEAGGICRVNNDSGIVENCINNSDIYWDLAGGICGLNLGQIVNCINYGSIYGGRVGIGGIAGLSDGTILNCNNHGNLYGQNIGGIFCYSYESSLHDTPVNIDNCINYGDIHLYTVQGYETFGGGICSYYWGRFSSIHIIQNCINNGHFILSDNQHDNITIGGIIGCSEYYLKLENCKNHSDIIGKTKNAGGICGKAEDIALNNCSNYGNISNALNAGGICGHIDLRHNFGYSFEYGIWNCFNSGNISGSGKSGGIIGYISKEDEYSITNIKNCLNIGQIIRGGGLFGNNNTDIIYDERFIFENNYYDKQMSTVKAIANEDISNIAQGHLTSLLTGTGFNLQNMLGDGWSYAEERYPIPLGHENDSMALVAATPLYLNYQNNEIYDNVNSVNRNFTLGIQNNVNWLQRNNNVEIEGNIGKLLNEGEEILTVYLNNYYKDILINITDITEPGSHPELLSTMPHDGENNVNTNTQIFATFNMNITEADLSLINITPSNGNLNISIENDRINILHNELNYKTQYTVNIPASAIEGLTTDISWNFSTRTGGELKITTDKSSEFFIFPNPASDFITITNTGEIKNYIIYDTTGKILMSGSNISNNILNLNNIDNGTYYIKIETKNNILIKKFSVVKNS